MERGELRDKLGKLDDTDRIPVLFETLCLWSKENIRKSFFINGKSYPIRMLVIFGAALPFTLWLNQPTQCNPRIDLLATWGWTMMMTLSLYKLLPV